MKAGTRRWLLLAAVAAAAAAAAASVAGGGRAQALPVPHPTVSDYAQVAASTTPPTEAQCFSVGRRCFTPASTRAAYNLGPLYAAGLDGHGMTIAIVDSYGSDTIAHDLHVYDTAFSLPPMCGEEGVSCTAGMPKFSQLSVQGSPATKASPSTSNGTGQEDKAAWALDAPIRLQIER